MSDNITTAWEKMQIIRNKNRPTALDYIPMIFDDFFEMHGDRYYGDDHALIGGIAYFRGLPVTIIAQVKGHDLAENQYRNFAMPHPEGYRKALRLARQAEKFGRPIICFIDTPGAFCGVEAEERGQGEAIARCIMEFMTIKTPILSIILGEGGSGGALALGVCDELAMLENAIYSVISPRGCASILWKDASKEEQAANLLHITADDLIKMQICDYKIEEAENGANTDPHYTAENISKFIFNSLQKNLQKRLDELLELRYNKFRRIGEFETQGL